MRPKKVALLATLLTSLLGCYGFIRIEPIEDADIVNEDGKQILVLSEQLEQAIESNFPNLRMATQADMIGRWATGGFPFIAWGDFNGDGMQDIAVFLFNEQEWEAPIFHKTPQGYEVAFNLFGNVFDPGEGPQAFLLYTMPKDDVVSINVYDEIEDLEKTIELDFEFDAVTLSTDESSGTFVFWQDGQYQTESL